MHIVNEILVLEYHNHISKHLMTIKVTAINGTKIEHDFTLVTEWP
jgi:hypothetical protein